MSKANDTQKPKLYKQAPLPFVGQKRFFLPHFRKILDNYIQGNGEDWTIIDVFGGSGLLSNNAKHCKPNARVIYNDFDNYSERLKYIDDSNRLRKLLYAVLEHEPRRKLSKPIIQKVKKIINNFDGIIDIRALSTWLLFTGNHAKNIDDLFTFTLYNNIRKSDYAPADDYLTGLEIINQSYEQLLAKFSNQEKTLLLLDPPYICTAQNAYKDDRYFGMVQFLELMEFVRPPYVFFGSTKSELLDYLQFVKTHRPIEWQRLGGDFCKISFNATINHSASYEDNLIYNFGGAK